MSTNDENQDKHVICIYTPDILNREDIYECERYLRRLLLLYNDGNNFNILTYKPDICTLIGIYRGHKIRPTISPPDMTTVLGRVRSQYLQVFLDF